jgi:RHS repeat-associated protein
MSQFTYDPYGKVNQSQGSVASDFQYAGYYHHTPSGFGLTLNRAYNSSLGRWINRDPIGEIAGANLFTYCTNNPVCFIDPLGLKSRMYKGTIGGQDGVQAPADPAIQCPVQPPPCVPRYAPPPPLEGYAFREGDSNDDCMKGDGYNNCRAPDHTEYNPQGREICGTRPHKEAPNNPDGGVAI